MPSTKHVVSVRLTDGQHETLERFAHAIGMSKGGVVLEVLGDMLPYMDRMAEALTITEAANERTKDAAKEVIFRKMTDEEAKAEAVEQEAMTSLHRIMAKVDLWAQAESSARRGAPAARGVPSRRRS